MFHNYMTGKKEAVATEAKGGRHFIKIGFAGFNAPANNRGGYDSQDKAERAIRRYEAKLMTYTIWSNAGRWEWIVYDGDRVVGRSGLIFRSRHAARMDLNAQTF
jgi:hypothetical protein